MFLLCARLSGEVLSIVLYMFAEAKHCLLEDLCCRFAATCFVAVTCCYNEWFLVVLILITFLKQHLQSTSHKVSVK